MAIISERLEEKKLINVFISAPETVQSHKTAAANKDKRNANEH